MNKHIDLLLCPFNNNIKTKNTLLAITKTKEKNIKKIVYYENKYSSRKKLLEKYQECEKIYKSILTDLIFHLNKIHKINFSYKAWEIILGIWLKHFIYITYYYCSLLAEIKKKNNIKNTHIIKNTKYDICLNDTTELFKEWWVFSLISKLICFSEKKNKSNIKEYNLKKKFINDGGIAAAGYKKSNNKYIKKKIFSYLKILKKKNDALIIETYLPFFEEKKLELMFGQVPQYWEKMKIDYKKINKEIRSKIILKNKKTTSETENFIRSNISEILPKFVLENFNDIRQLSLSSGYPSTPKFIFTSSSYGEDEVFKFYCAKKHLQKVPIFIGQHGNTYFSYIHSNYSVEQNFCDKFISWGFKKKPKIIPACNFLIKKKIQTNKEKLLIVLEPICPPITDLSRECRHDEKAINNVIWLIKNLEKDIQKNIILRASRQYYDSHLGFKYIDLIKKLDVEIDSGKTNFLKLLSSSRLVIFNHDSTGMLDAFNYNIPTLFICKKNFFQQLNKSFVKKYQMLLKSKIMFNKVPEVKKHVEENWNNIGKFWNSDSVKKSINFFNKNYNIINRKNKLLKLKSAIIS